MVFFTDNLDLYLGANTSAVKQENEPDAPQYVKDVFEWLDVLVTAIISVVIIFSFLFRIATIDGDSMENTLIENQKVVITNLFYTPKVGDIVVISRNTYNDAHNLNQNSMPIIKRVIATEGQMVDIDFTTGIVYVDGKALDEPYTKTPTNVKHDIEFPVIVNEGCIFVLGDNRNESLDSRSSQIGDYGMVDTRYVLGHAVYRIFPFNVVGGLK